MFKLSPFRAESALFLIMWPVIAVDDDGRRWLFSASVEQNARCARYLSTSYDGPAAKTTKI